MSPVTAVKTAGDTDIAALLGADAEKLLAHVCKGIPKESLHLPGPDFVDRVFAQIDRTAPVLRSLQQLFGHGRLGRHRLPVDPAGGPGHRALGGRIIRQEPDLLRSGKHRQAGDRGRVQRRCLDARGARLLLEEVRAQDPVPPEVQPQRIPDLPEQVRPDLVRAASSRRATWARLRSAQRSISARRNRRARSSR